MDGYQDESNSDELSASSSNGDDVRRRSPSLFLEMTSPTRYGRLLNFENALKSFFGLYACTSLPVSLSRRQMSRALSLLLRLVK